MKRPALTLAPVLAGRRVHITFDLGLGPIEPMGVPVAIMIRNGEKLCEGAYEQESLRALSEVINLALEYGAPVAALAERLRGTMGGPHGDVVDGPAGVVRASSVPDLVGQLLARAVEEP